MPVTLMALYRRPAGGDEALKTFRRRYADEHLPLVRATPGLISLTVDEVVQTFGDTDIILVAQMIFSDREQLDAGLASDAMRQAGRNLREIAPGLSTLIVLEPDVAMVPYATTAATLEQARENPAPTVGDGGDEGSTPDAGGAASDTGAGTARDTGTARGHMRDSE
ncbi:MAG: EthD family reductase [Chloroflexi bacterium]|nr:EthD family reductase [Chloroflexota bacterium]